MKLAADTDLEDVLTEHEQAELKALNDFLASRCVVCGAVIEPGLARLFSTTCLDCHRPDIAA